MGKQLRQCLAQQNIKLEMTKEANQKEEHKGRENQRNSTPKEGENREIIQNSTSMI